MQVSEKKGVVSDGEGGFPKVMMHLHSLSNEVGGQLGKTWLDTQ